MSAATRQFATFYLGERMYGIDVMKVQEVTNPLPMTAVRLAPAYVKGLINLRGQIATAIGLRELFHLSRGAAAATQMTVVCRCDGNLLSLLVDRIGDVIEVSQADFEPSPDTLEGGVRKFMEGVYKIENRILSVVGVERIVHELNESNE